MKAIMLLMALLASLVPAYSAQGQRAVHKRYHLEVLDGLGGTSSTGNSINDVGWISGQSNLPGNQSRHATLWRQHERTDLGTLGGPNSAVIWPVKNALGIVSGIAQTAEPDPLNENWSCSAFFPGATRAGLRCLGFRWTDGVMTALPTLGGTHGFAAGTNSQGHTAGWAENNTIEPTCVAPQRLQFRAVVWTPDGTPNELPPLPGDPTSAATAINDRGDVVGISGICDSAVGRRSAVHAVRWRAGVVEDLGNLGGDAWNTPTSVNARGDIVGFSNTTPGVDFAPRAFLWTSTKGIVDLGVLSGDATSQGSGLNYNGSIVGQSCSAKLVCRGFLWERGVMHDLQALIVSGDDATIITASDIDNEGRISGQARDNATGRLVAFRAKPLD